jgi:hypothetical protein
MLSCSMTVAERMTVSDRADHSIKSPDGPRFWTFVLSATNACFPPMFRIQRIAPKVSDGLIPVIPLARKPSAP